MNLRNRSISTAATTSSASSSISTTPIIRRSRSLSRSRPRSRPAQPSTKLNSARQRTLSDLHQTKLRKKRLSRRQPDYPNASIVSTTTNITPVTSSSNSPSTTSSIIHSVPLRRSARLRPRPPSPITIDTSSRTPIKLTNSSPLCHDSATGFLTPTHSPPPLPPLPLKRRVHFDPSSPRICYVSNEEEYDRKVCETDWWIQFDNQQVTHADAVQLYWNLDVYKLYELAPQIIASRSLIHNHSLEQVDDDPIQSMRFDILTTPELRAALVRDMSLSDALNLTVPEICIRLDSHLFEYDPGYQSAAPALAALWERLHHVIKIINPDWVPLLETPDKVPGMIQELATVIPDIIDISLDDFITKYLGEDTDTTMTRTIEQIHSLYIFKFVKPSRPFNTTEWDYFARLMILALSDTQLPALLPSSPPSTTSAPTPSIQPPLVKRGTHRTKRNHTRTRRHNSSI